MNLTPEEREHLVAMREAIEILFDTGKWAKINGQLYWCVPEEAALQADKILEVIEE